MFLMMFLCSISFVSANDLNGADEIQTAENTLSIDDVEHETEDLKTVDITDSRVQNDNNKSFEEDNSKLGSAESNYGLQETIDDTSDVPEDSFSALYEFIGNRSETNLTLDKDYVFYPNYDANFSEGIVINDTVLIDGNGHRIDGANQARIFNITGNGVTLKNIILVNGYAANGSAIYSTGDSGKIFNSVILNNTGSLIYSESMFDANNNWWGNTNATFDAAPDVSDKVDANYWLFLTVTVNDTVVNVGKKASVIVNLTNVYDKNTSSKSTYADIVPITFDLNVNGVEVESNNATLEKGVAEFLAEVYGPEYGNLNVSYFNVEDGVIFTVVSDDDSFTALQKLINNATEREFLNLTRNYKYYDYDVKYADGVVIDKSIGINGNGFTINGSDKSGIFNIPANEVYLSNMTISNAGKDIVCSGTMCVADAVLFNDVNGSLSICGQFMSVVNSIFNGSQPIAINISANSTAYLSNNTLSKPGRIYNHGKFASPTFIVVLGNKTIDAKVGDKILLNATVSDDNGNVIVLDNLTFDIGSTDSIEGTLNETVFEAEYTLTNGTFIIGVKDIDDILMQNNVDYALVNVTKYNSLILINTSNVTQYNTTKEVEFIVENITNASAIITDELGNVVFDGAINSTTITLDNLDAGNYTIVATNEENEMYYGYVANETFEISKIASSIELSHIDDFTYGNVSEVEINVINRTAVEIVIRNSTDDIVYNESIEGNNFTLPVLATGNYTIVATNLETKNINGSNYTQNFTIYKGNSSIDVINYTESFAYGGALVVNFTKENVINIEAAIVDSSGNIIYIGNLTDDEVANGNFTYDNFTAVGNYTLTLTNYDNENASGCVASVNFTVIKSNSTVNVWVDSVSLGENVTINYEVFPVGIINVVVEDLNGNVVYNQNVTGNNVTIEGLKAGNYTAYVNNLETDNVYGNSSNATFSVLAKEDYNITVDLVDKTVNIHAPSDANGIATIINGNDTYSVELVNGSASVDIPELVQGINTIIVSYAGDDKYSPKNFTFDVLVKTQVVASDMTRGYNSGVDYQFKVTDANGNPLANKIVDVAVNGQKFIVVTDAKGVAKLNEKLPVGTYTVTVTNPDSGSKLVNTLKIVKRIAGNKNLVKYYVSNFKYNLRVYGNDGKAVGAGVTVTVKMGKYTYKLKTNENGYITLLLNSRFPSGKYTVTASYKGYTTKNTITIKQIIVSKSVVTVKKSSGKLVLTAKLRQGSKVLKYKTVTFKMNGKTFSAKTNGYGLAKVTVKNSAFRNLQAGKTYLVKISFLKDFIKTSVKVRR